MGDVRTIAYPGYFQNAEKKDIVPPSKWWPIPEIDSKKPKRKSKKEVQELKELAELASRYSV